MKKIILLCLLVCSSVFGQTSPGLSYGQTPTAGQWNSYFAFKMDYQPVGSAGNVLQSNGSTWYSAPLSFQNPLTVNYIQYTFPATTATLARTDSAQTFTGLQTFGSITVTGADTAGSYTATSAIITPFYPSGILGNATGSAVTAGSIGETRTATGTAVSVTTGTPTTITSIALIAGEWEIYASVYFTPAATTTSTITQGGISATAATLPAIPLYTYMPITLAANTPIGYALPVQRVLTSGTPTYYCVAQATFAVSTMTATCIITAHRAG